MISSLPALAALCSGVRPSERLTVRSAPRPRRCVLFYLLWSALKNFVPDCLYPISYVLTFDYFIGTRMSYTILVLLLDTAAHKAVAPEAVVHSISAPMAIKALVASRAPHLHAWCRAELPSLSL